MKTENTVVNHEADRVISSNFYLVCNAKTKVFILLSLVSLGQLVCSGPRTSFFLRWRHWLLLILPGDRTSVWTF